MKTNISTETADWKKTDRELNVRFHVSLEFNYTRGRRSYDRYVQDDPAGVDIVGCTVEQAWRIEGDERFAVQLDKQSKLIWAEYIMAKINQGYWSDEATDACHRAMEE